MQSLWILVSALLFALMVAAVKIGAGRLGAMEIVFYRSLIGMILIVAFARARRRSLATENLRVHLWRGMTGFIALALFFWCIPRLPLATAFALNYTSPLFLAALTAVFMREKIDLKLGGALLICFAGVICLLRPGISAEQAIVGLAGLASGFFAGCAYFNIRRLGKLNEGGIRTVFYLTLISTAAALALNLGYGEFHRLNWNDAAVLLAVGVTATFAQLALTRALAFGHTLVAGALGYSAIIFSGAADYFIWQSRLTLFDFIGIGLIVGGGVFSIYAHLKMK